MLTPTYFGTMVYLLFQLCVYVWKYCMYTYIYYTCQNANHIIRHIPRIPWYSRYTPQQLSQCCWCVVFETNVNISDHPTAPEHIWFSTPSRYCSTEFTQQLTGPNFYDVELLLNCFLSANNYQPVSCLI